MDIPVALPEIFLIELFCVLDRIVRRPSLRMFLL